MNDMADSQLPAGLVPTIAPEYTIFRDKGDTNNLRGKFGDSPEWGGAIILAAWQHYVWTADLSLLRELYPAMQRYYAYLQGRSQGQLLSHGLGDWFDLGPAKPGVAQLTPVSLTATAFLAECARTLAGVADLVGRPDEPATYRMEGALVRSAFEKAFFHPESGTFATGSQTAQALPLAFDLVPEGQREAALDALVKDVRSRGNAVTTGDVGYRSLLRSLADGGDSDVIFAMVNQSERPGYGFQLAKGCTSLAETWTADRTASQNHFMLGQIIEWFYGDLAGISPVADSPGFKRIVIRPQPVGDLEWVRASHESPRGPVKVEWRRAAGWITLDVEIPPNATAEVSVPAKEAMGVSEGDGPAGASPGVAFLRAEPGRAVYSVGSGRYRFKAPLP
jgi:alpha-L-rhamnosidase